MLVRLVPLLAVCAAALVACGGSGGASDDARSPTTTQTTPHGGDPQRALGLPSRVPLEATGAADPARAKVIRAWADALRSGHVGAASAQWGVPSKIQNATPLLVLHDRSDVRAFNDSLPCGAIVTGTRGAPRDFTIVTFQLTSRPGGACGSGSGNTARTAIRVLGGKIVEWYRLPDADGTTGDSSTV
ncbi:MAG: hypothetical protein QOG15_3335 [Solirubrobacteraceae bacterium]|jgi:hypothetical protein|nr:hypothetical protein [Solirubrobacteraceae bacterium]